MSELYICRLASEPGDKECLEAIASEGRACKRCDIDCYRRGFSKEEAAADNRKLVSQKRLEFSNE